MGREQNDSEHVYSERARLMHVLRLSWARYEWKVEKKKGRWHESGIESGREHEVLLDRKWGS